MKNLKMRERVLAIALATGVTLTGCKSDNLKKVDEQLPENILNTIMIDEEMYPGMLDSEFINQINTLKIKLNILENIYDANLNLSQAKPITEDININNLSIEEVQKMIETTKKPISIIDPRNREEIEQSYRTLDMVNYIKEELEKELLTKDCYEELEILLKKAIKMAVASAVNCHPGFVKINERTDHNAKEYSITVKRRFEEETYKISQEDAPETWAALDYLYEYQLDKEGILASDNENKIETYQKIINLIVLTITEGLSLQDNNLIARHTEKTIEEILDGKSKYGINSFVSNNNMLLKMYDLGTNSSKVLCKM